MKKHLALAAAMAVGLATPALAQDADACLKQAFDLAASAEGKNLSEAQLAKVEELLAKMEGHCDAKQFADADKTAADVKAAIEGK
jgi:predicted mannosyl-3-phosphoglycerate phosphatase (HAD superfamily)